MGFHKGQKVNSLFRFRQPSVPEEEKKDKGYVKIIPIPAWRDVRCVVVIHVTFQAIQ